MNAINPSIFEACLPWAICLIVAVIAARILVAISGAKLNLARLRSIHDSEEGSVQSLSFVLTLPFFVMILMMIIQVNQIMFGNIIVHYSAFAAVRSGSVWIPATAGSYESTNRISSMTLINSTSEGQQFLINPTSDKYSKIQQAATLACMTLGPSRDLGYELADPLTHTYLVNLYQGTNPGSQSNDLISNRLRNKLAYSYPNTSVRLTVWHRYGSTENWWREPPLQVRYDIPPFRDEYYMNELGWQDELTAEVTYNLPLLPGPVRFFAPTGNFDSDAAGGADPSTDQSGEAYIWPLTAAATMMIEGEKPLVDILQEEFQ